MPRKFDFNLFKKADADVAPSGVGILKLSTG